MTVAGAAPAPRTSSAFAPGHISCLFSPDLSARDPRGRGSRGAGIVLELGARATATWDRDAATRIRVTSQPRSPLPISTEVVHRLFGPRRGGLRVTLRHELPVGQGFGMSAAGALASGLAVADAVGLPPQKAIEVAHLADLYGHGGLGGVSSILGGGLEWRERPGVPPWGRISHQRFPHAIWLIPVGPPIPSAKLLRNPAFLDEVRRASSEGLARLQHRFTAATVIEEAERFGERLRLGDARVERVLRRIREAGIRSAQAMFGASVYAVPRSLRDRSVLVKLTRNLRLPAVEIRAATSGARPTPLDPGARESV